MSASCASDDVSSRLSPAAGPPTLEAVAAPTAVAPAAVPVTDADGILAERIASGTAEVAEAYLPSKGG